MKNCGIENDNILSFKVFWNFEHLLAFKMPKFEFEIDPWGGFHKPIQALRHTFTPKKASQELGVEHKMALRPTFNLHEIDPGYENVNKRESGHG